MNSHHIGAALAADRRNTFLAQAETHRLAKEARDGRASRSARALRAIASRLAPRPVTGTAQPTPAPAPAAATAGVSRPGRDR